MVVWVRGQLGLVDPEWHRARVQASRLITALELELRPDSDLKVLEALYGPAGVISARVFLRLAACASTSRATPRIGNATCSPPSWTTLLPLMVPF